MACTEVGGSQSFDHLTKCIFSSMSPFTTRLPIGILPILLFRVLGIKKVYWIYLIVWPLYFCFLPTCGCFFCCRVQPLIMVASTFGSFCQKKAALMNRIAQTLQMTFGRISTSSSPSITKDHPPFPLKTKELFNLHTN